MAVANASLQRRTPAPLTRDVEAALLDRARALSTILALLATNRSQADRASAFRAFHAT